MSRPPLMLPEELAERWQVPVSQVYRLARDGRIPTVRIGRYVRFDAAQIERYETREEGPDHHESA